MINISEIILIRGNLENKVLSIANELLSILGNDNLLISQNRIQELIKLEDNLFTLNSMIEFGVKNCDYIIIGGDFEKQENEKILLINIKK